MSRIEPLANDFITIYRSDSDNGEYCYTPGICVLPNGRVIATIDHKGPEVPAEETGMVFISDDAAHFRRTGFFPLVHARPFVAGNSVYIIGQRKQLGILRSDDWGETWGPVSWLTEPEPEGCSWGSSAMNVWYTEDRVYLVMDHKVAPDCKAWPVAAQAPVLMRANIHDDLLKRESWTFASEMFFRDVIDQDTLDYFGIPFFQVPRGGVIDTAEGHVGLAGKKRICAPIGWLETNVVRIMDEKHYWYDPKGRTYHLLARAHTGGSGYGCIVKVVEKDDGTMETCFEHVPSGRRIVFLPIPGGQMRFHVLYDEVTHLYWLLSTQATDSMTRSELLPEDRYNLPNNERRRLVLHFSKNLVDWCFAGLVAIGNSEKEARHYASMAIRGDDLLIFSRSGDQRSRDAHDGNISTLHIVKDFRSLVY
ncbi:MAG: exo-alpha-sialidase [Clostridia bacterium]|nr:exo-alpha-sialidase [Clostridia bacterium]